MMSRIFMGVILLLIVSSLVFVGGGLQRNQAHAQGTGGTITGWAWSDTIGWVSLNGTYNGITYGLSVAANGTITGWAWSDTIGWVSANAANLSGCPTAPCTARINASGQLEGWLRALSGTTGQSGGWDGFISLRGSNYGPTRGSGGTFSGYAWGDINVGWVSFNYASTNHYQYATANVQARPAGSSTWSSSLTIDPGDQIEVGWNQGGTTNTSACQALPNAHSFSTGGAASGVDSDVMEPIGNSSISYGVLCTGTNVAQNNASVVVTTRGGVGAQFIPCPSGGAPDFVTRNSTVNLCWELGTNDPAQCSILAGAATIVPSPVSDPGSFTTDPILGEVTFTLSCIGGDSDEVTIKVLPDFQET